MSQLPRQAPPIQRNPADPGILWPGSPPREALIRVNNNQAVPLTVVAYCGLLQPRRDLGTTCGGNHA